jgi:hypothetical protein
MSEETPSSEATSPDRQASTHRDGDMDLGDLLAMEIIPRLMPEQVFTHPAHDWKCDGDKGTAIFGRVSSRRCGSVPAARPKARHAMGEMPPDAPVLLLYCAAASLLGGMSGRMVCVAT